MPAGVFAFVTLFGFSLLCGSSAAAGLHGPPWQDILLDEDETDPLESKLSLLAGDGQPAIASSALPLVSFHPRQTLVRSLALPPLRFTASAPTGPRAPPAA